MRAEKNMAWKKNQGKNFCYAERQVLGKQRRKFLSSVCYSQNSMDLFFLQPSSAQTEK